MASVRETIESVFGPIPDDDRAAHEAIARADRAKAKAARANEAAKAARRIARTFLEANEDAAAAIVRSRDEGSAWAFIGAKDKDVKAVMAAIAAVGAAQKANLVAARAANEAIAIVTGRAA
jgi:photosystem II stability/assembly factor-like uncharacterized protein